MGGLRRQMSSARFFLVIVALGLVGLFSEAKPLLAQQSLFAVDAINVEGTRRVAPETVISYSELAEDSSVTASEINAALGRIFASGLFEDVQIFPEGNILRIVVIENPTINQVAFEGNELISDEVLTETSRLQPRRAFRRSDVEADAAAIIETYRAAGRYNAIVNPVIIRQPDNRVDVVFEITEGDVSEVERISFIGNRRFTDSALRDAILTKQAGIFSSLFRADNFNADRVDVDREQLRQFYLNEGHADFKILSTVTELNETRDGFFLTFTLEEGPIYDFGEIEILSSATGLEPEDLQAVVGFQTGQTFAQSAIEDSIEAIGERAGELGYPFVQVRPRVNRNAETRSVNIVFDIVEGTSAFVERIDIVGNTRTLDRVIRREFDLVEGDAFDARSLQRTADRLRSLGFFSKVDISPRRGSADNQAIVRMEVEDRLTGSASLGVTYNSAAGAGVVLGLSENNLLGRGQRLALDVSTDDETRSLGLSFTEPRFLDRDLSVGAEIYNRSFDRSTAAFQQRNVGFEPTIGFPVSEPGRITLRYQISEDEIFSANDTSTVSKLIRDDVGTAFTSAVGATYSHDRRNSRFAPTRGYIYSIATDVAGFGGDTTFLKSTARLKLHTAFRDDIPAFAELEVGALASADNSRITDRYFLGGSSFRGFAYGGMGPRDTDQSGSTSVNSALGGNYYTVLRLQTSFPLGFGEAAGLNGGLFLNAGSLWGLDVRSAGAEAGVRGAFEVDDSPKLRVSGGFTLFWDSPLGPLRLDFGRAIVKENGDEQEAFRLGAGRRY